MSGLTKTLNFVGGLPDRLMERIPEFMLEPCRCSRQEYGERLAFYAAGRPWPWLELPGEAPAAQTVATRPVAGARQEHVVYPSRYRARHPGLEEELNRFEANRYGHLYRWGTPGQRRPLVLCLHGFMMGTPGQALSMFRIRKLLALGLDAALFIHPFHGPRSSGGRKQHLLNPYNVPLTIEALGQAVHDLHSGVLALRAAGHDRIGIIGASLGGFVAALYAAVASAVEFAFLAVPAVDFFAYLDPRGRRFPFPVDEELVQRTRQALAAVSPLNSRPALPPERIKVVSHAGDRICDPRLTRELVKAWKIPDHLELIGGHWLYFDRGRRGEAWYEWLRKTGFIPAAAEG